jgi:flagellar hook-associated protein 2
MGDSADAMSALSKLGLFSGVKEGSAEYASYQKWAGYNFNTLNDEGQIADEQARSVYDKELASRVSSYKETIINAQDSIEALRKKNDDLNAQKANATLTDEDIAAIEQEIVKNNGEIASQTDIIGAAREYVNESGEATDALKSDTIAFLKDKSATAQSALNGGFDVATGSDAPVRITGQNAQIYLNGAFFESSTNSFDINGLNINCTGTTGLTDQAKSKPADQLTAEDYNTITLTTGTDTDGIYKTIKNFIKEYNDLIKEMDTKYNADKATDYDILTDEQKSAMSEKEIEAWDTKIKDSLLRRDENLSSMIDTMKRSMQGAYEINGKQYSLASFGIETMSYFLAGANEKGVYHIDGDPDDNETSGNEDKLKAMIAADPDAVQEFFTKLTNDMYSTLSKKAASSVNSSYGSFYDDKAMGTQYTKYKTALSDYEKKLGDIEDKYYKQFSAMETALTKLQNSSSAITGLFNY